jgi:tetratricopeptide (TPR) repeat protein
MNKLPLIAIAFLFLSCNNNSPKTVNKNEKFSQEQQLMNAIKMHPDSMLLKENLIQFYRDSGNYSKAIEQTNEFISKDSLNDRLWEIKGTLHFENNDTSLAIISLENTLTLKPSLNKLIFLGTLLAETKQKTALEIADSILLNYKENAQKEALFIKGTYFSSLGDYIKAIDYFDQCIKVSYTFMEAYREKSLCLMNQKKYNEAIFTLTKAITIKNNYQEGYYYLGQAYEKNKNIEEAIAAYQKALLYDPNDEAAANALNQLK